MTESRTKSERSPALPTLNHNGANVKRNWEALVWNKKKKKGWRGTKKENGPMGHWISSSAVMISYNWLRSVFKQFFTPVAPLRRLFWTSLCCCFEGFCFFAAQIYLWPVYTCFKIFPFLNSNLLLAAFSKSLGHNSFPPNMCSVMLTLSLSFFIFNLQQSRIIHKDKMKQMFQAYITIQTEI